MTLIGREKERGLLKASLESSKSELIAVYGRRRVGKTFLIREVMTKSISFEMTGLYKGNKREQLKNFSLQLGKHFKKAKKNNIPKDWSDAFEMLKVYIDSLPKNKKKVIFIDEFPWIATVRSKFLMWFENFWNSYCTNRTDIVVIICGSAASYMVQNIINNKGGLHNRISSKIILEPFNLYETDLFLKHKKIKFEKIDIVRLYMAIGGIPHYLDKIIKGQSVDQNIDRLCFEDNGDLLNEFDEIFASLFSNSKNHIQIVKVLSKISKGITRKELLRKCKLKQDGHSSKIINELQESGFIKQYTPFGKKGRNSLLRLSDEYSTFYLKFIESHKGQGVGTWAKLSAKQTYKAWSGYSFETLCLRHINQIKNELGISSVFTISSSWANANAQIDLVIDRDDNRIDICEMKFYDRPYTIKKVDYTNIANKISEFHDETMTRKGTHLTFITTFGIKQNEYSLSLVENNLTIDCLFKK